MKNILVGLSLLTALVLCACDRNSSVEVLYPIDSLVSGQIAMLSNSRATLTKVAMLDKKIDEKTYIPKDTSDWVRELDVFRQLRVMNKPINKENYIIDNELYDPSSNLTVKVFTAKEKLPVQSLRIFFEKSVLRPRKIEAVYNEENSFLYASSRNLLLEFEQINNKNVLTYYSIEGGQKMVMSDTVTFLVQGRIRLDKN